MSGYTIETLPTDVILKIVEKLDSYGVLSFLEVFPSFKNITALVTDHSYDPLFFRVSGVERKLLPIPGATKSSGLDVYTPKFARTHPIRLFDIHSNQPEVMRSLLELENTQDELKERQNVYFNSTTFVFIHTNYTSHPHELEALTRRLDEFTDCKWHVGLPTHFHDKKTAIICDQPRWKNTTQSLKSLRLVNVQVLEDCSFRNLRSLALIYTSSTFSDRPLVKGLRVPKLSRFVVHYTEKMPLFVDMGGVATSLPALGSQASLSKVHKHKVLLVLHLSGWLRLRSPFAKYSSTKSDLCTNDHITRVFELARIGRLEYRARYGKERETIQDVLDKETFETMDTSFISRFLVLHLYGAPVEIIKKIDFMPIIKLRLQIGRESASLSADFTIKQQLFVLTVVLQEDDCVYPSFTLPQTEVENPRPELALWLNIMGVNPRLANLFESRLPSANYVPPFTTLCIYYPPRLIKRVGSSTGLPISPPIITHAEWLSMVGVLGSYMDEYKELSLIGFQMPFLTRNPEVLERRKYRWGVPTCPLITIRPLMFLDPKDPHHQLIINNMYLWTGAEGLYRGKPFHPDSCIFTCAPIFEMVPSVDVPVGAEKYNKRTNIAGEYKKDIILQITTIPMIADHTTMCRGSYMRLSISKQFTGFRWYAHDLVSSEKSASILGVNKMYNLLPPYDRDEVWRAIEPVASQSGVVNEWWFGYGRDD